MDISVPGADRLRQLIADYTGVDVSQITDEAHFIDDLGIDWLDQLELLILVEEEFVGVEFSDSAAIDFVGDLIRCIEMNRMAISEGHRSAA